MIEPTAKAIVLSGETQNEAGYKGFQGQFETKDGTIFNFEFNLKKQSFDKCFKNYQDLREVVFMKVVLKGGELNLTDKQFCDFYIIIQGFLKNLVLLDDAFYETNVREIVPSLQNIADYSNHMSEGKQIKTECFLVRKER